MGRPRALNEAAALDAAMDCFWRDGYEATSVRDLAARTGTNGTSLYNAFGDKRLLFREVLRRYADRSTRERITRFETTLPSKEAIRAFFGEIIDRSIGDDRRRCLLVNTAIEVAPPWECVCWPARTRSVSCWRGSCDRLSRCSTTLMAALAACQYGHRVQQPLRDQPRRNL
jgi:AcrR family transcriptional regulator